jgi:vacuolar-type H+-ATPase subunit E/Vma4
MIDQNLVARFCRLTEQKRALKGQSDETQKELDAIEEQLQEAFLANGVQNQGVHVDGKRWTIYVKETHRASILAAERERAYASLRAAGLGDLIQPTVHPSTLTAWVRERLEAEEPLPVLDGVEIRAYHSVHAIRG